MSNTPFEVPDNIRKLFILGYTEGEHYTYDGYGGLKILNIPNNSILEVKAYCKTCMCERRYYYTLQYRDGVLYDIG